jgi:anti-sigma B factor antagonist
MTPKPFFVNVRSGRTSDIIVFSVTGPLVLEHLCTFRDVWDAHTEPVFIFDVGKLSYMDSAAVGFLVNAYLSRQKSGKKLALAGVNGIAKQILNLTRVNSVITTYPSVEAAEDEFLQQEGVKSH